MTNEWTRKCYPLQRELMARELDDVHHVNPDTLRKLMDDANRSASASPSVQIRSSSDPRASANAESPKGGIGAQLDLLKGAISSLEEKASYLGDHLMPIIDPNPNRLDSPRCDPAPHDVTEMSPLASELATLMGRIRMVAEYLSDLAKVIDI